MIVRIPILLGAWLVLAMALAGCSPKAGTDATAAKTNDQRVFQVKGVVQEVTPAEKSVKIAHEEIPGYMKAMTMNFDVKSTNELRGLKPGDTVLFRMIVMEKDAWIENITTLSANSTTAVVAPPNMHEVPDVPELDVGQQLPAYKFTNELGQVVDLGNQKGKAIAFTFIFTRCPYPTYCPRMSMNLEEVQKQLKDMPNAPTNWHLFTITFDPEFDTLEVLRSYSARYHADPRRWNFLTGKLYDITALTQQFQLMFWRPNPAEPAGITHNLVTVVVDTTGKISAILRGGKWEAKELTDAIVAAARQPSN